MKSGYNHPFYTLLANEHKSGNDIALIEAIAILSSSVFTWLFPTEVYDKLVTNQACSLSANILLAGASRMSSMERILLHKLNQLEHTLTTASDRANASMKALQDEIALLTKAQADLQVSTTNANQKIISEVTTLIDLVNQLRQAGQGTGQEAVLNALADQADQAVASLKTVADSLVAGTVAEDNLQVPAIPDPIPAPTPPPTSTSTSTTELTIAPTSATLAPGQSQPFTASEVVVWSAQKGSIGTDGVYVAPPDAASNNTTSDVITATAVADSARSISVSVSISF